MVEANNKPKYVRAVDQSGNFLAMESSSPVLVVKDYDSRHDGDLFLFQMSQAIEGVKEILPEINFRRKHPKLGQKIGEIERRLRKVGESIENIKYLLKPELQNGIKRIMIEDFENRKDKLWKTI